MKLSRYSLKGTIEKGTTFLQSLLPHPWAEVFSQIPTTGTDKMTNAREAGWARFELTEPEAFIKLKFECQILLGILHIVV